MKDLFYSNCVIETIKAKIHNSKIKLKYIPKDYYDKCMNTLKKWNERKKVIKTL